jgi:hypothetical protein
VITSRVLIIGTLAACLVGCSYSKTADIELQTNAKGQLVSTRIVKPSGYQKADILAVETAKRNFRTKVRDPKPNQTYNQTVNVIYTMTP